LCPCLGCEIVSELRWTSASLIAFFFLWIVFLSSLVAIPVMFPYVFPFFRSYFVVYFLLLLLHVVFLFSLSGCSSGSAVMQCSLSVLMPLALVLTRLRDYSHISLDIGESFCFLLCVVFFLLSVAFPVFFRFSQLIELCFFFRLVLHVRVLAFLFLPGLSLSFHEPSS
jgi:hypothetical protein